MAKYIGTYANSGDVQTALNEQELNRPFIAYTTDNEDVIFGAAADRGEVGDIVVYSVTDDLLHYIKQADYNTTSYPVASYVPVGVVAIPQADDTILGPSGEITFMALKWLDNRYPNNGSANGSTMKYGLPGLDFSGLTNYSDSGTAITDLTGKAENNIVIQDYCSANTDWMQATTISSDASTDSPAPAFECAWRYHTSGTVQGDWYVPALGELYFSINNQEAFANLASGLSIVHGSAFNYSGKNIASSTEQDDSYIWRIERGAVRNDSKQYSALFVRPFCSKLMTRI